MEAALAECVSELPVKVSFAYSEAPSASSSLCWSSLAIERKRPSCPNLRSPRHGRLCRRLHAQGCVGTSGPHQSAKPCHSPTAQTGNNIHRHFVLLSCSSFHQGFTSLGTILCAHAGRVGFVLFWLGSRGLCVLGGLHRR